MARFTGAASRHIGRFEQANGGTLFLDEIAELSSSVQSKVLRVLQERRLRRVGGGAKELEVDFRLIAASHRKLWTEVQEGRFREDLYFRLVVFEVEIPPLRERAGDVGLLVEHFARIYGEQLRGRVPAFATETVAILARYKWPGNVRELQNIVQRAIVSCAGDTVLPSDLPPQVVQGASVTSKPPAAVATGSARQVPDSLVVTAGQSLADIEKRAIEWALARTEGNVSEAARQLGIARTTPLS